MTQNSKRALTASAYQQLAPPTYYRTGPYPPNVSHEVQISQLRHAPQPLITGIPAGIRTGAQITTRDDRAISKTWHDEWETEPRPFGPRRPLALLNQSVQINLQTHPRNAKRVYLNHWDRQHEPNGTTAQRLVIQERQVRMERRTMILRAEQQEERRREVKQAAMNADVVDLTGDGISDEKGPWRHDSVGHAGLPGSSGETIHTWDHSWQL
ncbi:hypothetical protein GGP41_001959 [Bipolaris sorokiniana]|uniref:Uncharacterized protein n=2 Tax=Cochliobolus sativus TaxID=45130 RepID=A0A8H6E0F0_COCSA|nr:uncharacterized protein COCSADRAFT_221886 [Bipolaris sorokiniana ND90Pr]EMD62529.1 hypothetical protein COCSADRAFT_221886 [Bipolaris sorokiniana ND90Pr]KAF5853395.1 hypothetical protein GGP41_001959 [Bipolaris sorokiniana]